eukprot:TRINITY_DN12994_c0_g1_i1.p1 TRINITY_DN12994_c0_g1~~TRINITY_DN12994_c0_g1_i1.p1  ORF type:complete len:156 (+),score=24.13 TRINITY_DN12994_c0_g1_i1:69-536(+)
MTDRCNWTKRETFSNSTIPLSQHRILRIVLPTFFLPLYVDKQTLNNHHRISPETAQLLLKSICRDRKVSVKVSAKARCVNGKVEALQSVSKKGEGVLYWGEGETETKFGLDVGEQSIKVDFILFQDSYENLKKHEELQSLIIQVLLLLRSVPIWD